MELQCHLFGMCDCQSLVHAKSTKPTLSNIKTVLKGCIVLNLLDTSLTDCSDIFLTRFFFNYMFQQFNCELLSTSCQEPAIRCQIMALSILVKQPRWRVVQLNEQHWNVEFYSECLAASTNSVWYHYFARIASQIGSMSSFHLLVQQTQIILKFRNVVLWASFRAKMFQ